MVQEIIHLMSSLAYRFSQSFDSSRLKLNSKLSKIASKP